MGFSILCLGLVLAGCSQESGRTPELNNPDVVAQVNGENIPKSVLVDELRTTKRKYRIKKNENLQPEELLLLKTKTLNELIQQTLLLQEALRNNIKVSRNEFRDYLGKIKQGYQEETFQQALEIEEISQKRWNDKLRNMFLIKKLIRQNVNSKVKISEDELLKYFQEHEEEFQKGEQVRALHIMVDTEEEAREILKLLRKGKSFSDLARSHSLALEGSQGGDMGYFEAEQMPEEFDEVFKLGLNKVSDIIRTPYGFHVFKVVDKKPARKMSFEESRSKIQNLLMQKAQEEAFRAWLDKIKQKATIVINYDVFEKIS